MFYLLIGIVIAISFNDTFRERLAQNRRGRTNWIVDAHGYGKRFIVHADGILTAFLELERATRACRELS